MPTAFVLGLFDTGLAVVRSLARKGIAVRGFDDRCSNAGFRSRYGEHRVCPSPADEPEALADFLLAQTRRADAPALLFPTSDRFVAFVSRFRDQLHPRCLHVLPPAPIVDDALDKGRQHRRAQEIGIPVPRTHEPDSLRGVRALAPTFTYPALVKPAVGHVWRDRFRNDKGILVESPGQLQSAFEEVLAAGQTALVQSVIPGPNTNHYKVCGYVTPAEEVVATICMRKMRQHPSDFGTGTLMESIRDPELEALGIRVLKGFSWRGPGSVEFKRDERDGQLKLIELNGRLWQQNALADACGLNYPWIQHEYQCGRTPALPSPAIGVRWVDEARDLLSVWQRHRAGKLTVRRSLASWRRVRVSALFAADDPRPFTASLARYGGMVGRHVVGGPA